MNTDRENRSLKYLKAKKRTQEIKKFYKHLISYILVNIVISVFKVIRYTNEDYTLEEAIFQIDTFIVWIVWGVFVVFRALRVFGPNLFLGKGWEENKIKEIMKNIKGEKK